MSENIRYEFHLALISAGTGVGLMMVYDIFRILRMIVPHNAFWTGVEDLGYWIYCALKTYLLLYRQNDGSLRAYVIFAVILGMVGYQYFISQKLQNCLKNRWKYLKILMRKYRRKSNWGRR